MVPDLSKSILQVVSDGLYSKNRVRHKILSMTMVILYILRDVLTLNEEEKSQLVPQEKKSFYVRACSDRPTVVVRLAVEHHSESLKGIYIYILDRCRIAA